MHQLHVHGAFSNRRLARRLCVSNRTHDRGANASRWWRRPQCTERLYWGVRDAADDPWGLEFCGNWARRGSASRAPRRNASRTRWVNQGQSGISQPSRNPRDKVSKHYDTDDPWKRVEIW